MKPGVRFEARECNCLENSELAPRAGCTESITSLDTYAILATVAQQIDQLWTDCMEGMKIWEGGVRECIPASPTLATEAMDSSGS